MPLQAPDTRSTKRKDGKVLPLDQLGELVTRLRADNRKIVHCHGVFDLLHIGHLRHLELASRYGDVLVVTVTADEHVNKGPDRPAFPSELRCEMLAGLELIDHVAVVDAPSATPAIEAIQPDFYVKGGEYVDPHQDITGKIAIETKLVESFGGQMVFTDDITFSSSNLLNKFFAVHDDAARDYLSRLRNTGFGESVTNLLARLSDLRVVIVGETIIDRYVYVDAMGKAAKENIIATLHRDEEIFAGGVIAAANHLAAVCANVELITVVGDPNAGETYEDFIRSQLTGGIEATILHKPEAPTIQKTRFVEPTYVRKLFEVYHMDDRPLTGDAKRSLNEAVTDKIADADLVIVCDFGHGLISPDTVHLLESKAAFLAVNAQSNAGNIGYNLIDKFRRADFMCIDAMEARLAARDKHADLTEIVGERLPALVDCPNIIVTHGRAGCFAKSNGTLAHVPAFAGAVVDTVGAGDAFFSLAAPCVAAGADCETAGFVGNVAGAIKTGIVGHRRYLTRLEIQRYITTLLK